MTERCSAAHPADPTGCEGLTDAVLLRQHHDGAARLGCVHHAAQLLTSVPCTVFLGPSAYVGYPWGHDAAREAIARARQQSIS